MKKYFSPVYLGIIINKTLKKQNNTFYILNVAYFLYKSQAFLFKKIIFR